MNQSNTEIDSTRAYAMVGDNLVYEPGYSLLPNRPDKNMKIDSMAIFDQKTLEFLNNSVSCEANAYIDAQSVSSKGRKRP